MEKWRARQLQLTAYLHEPPDGIDRTFVDIVDQQPRGTQTGMLPDGTSRFASAQGFDSARNNFNVQSTGTRLDIVITPFAATNSSPVFFPNRAYTSDLLHSTTERFIGAVQTKKVNRLAVVVSLNQQTTSPDRLIITELGLSAQEYDGAIETAMATNLRRKAEWGEMNRILQWGSENFITVRFVAGIGQGLATTVPIPMAAWSIDVSSSASEPLQIAPDSVLRELVQEALQFWEKRDG